MLARADRLYDEGYYKKATKLYLDLLAKDPDNTSLMVKAADSLYICDDWGKYDGVMEENIRKMFDLLVKAVSLEPQNTNIRNRLALRLMLYGNRDTAYSAAAVKQLKKILEIEPTNLKALVYLSADFYLIDKSMTVEEVIGLFEKAISIDPNNYEIWERYGQFLGQYSFFFKGNVEDIAEKETEIRKVLLAFENVKSMMPRKDYFKRRLYIDGQIRKCRDLLSRLSKARKRATKQFDRAVDNHNIEERPLLDYLQYHILSKLIYGHPEPVFLTFYEIKRDTGASPDSILKAMFELERAGFSKAYDSHDEPIEVTFKELKKDLWGYTDRYLVNHYYYSTFYFHATEKGEKELDKKIYDKYDKLYDLDPQPRKLEEYAGELPFDIPE